MNAPWRPTRKAIRLLAVLAVAAAPAWVPAQPGAGGAPTVFREAKWEELVPKDWDPMKRFRDSQAGILADDSPRAMQLMREMREVWDNAPTIEALDGAAIRLPGYVVPLDETKAGLKEFLLVPYFGACIHTPPPPANQIVHVIVSAPARGLRTMDAVWVSGTLKTARQESAMGMSGYRMQAVKIDPYVPPQKPQK